MEQIANCKNFFLIAGPCVIESEEHCLFMAGEIKKICDKHGIFLIFKSSFDKANRTSNKSYRGLGIDEGLRILKKVKDTYGIPVITDVHETIQCEKAAEVCDVLQIPAFLCRQTDLLVAAAKTGKFVNIKKGQFCNDLQMKNAYDKCISTGNKNIMLCERGNMYGYDDLIVDFRNLVFMKKNSPDAKIVMDCTHALQQPNRGETTCGLRELVPTIARCAVVSGVDGLFMEVHDKPEEALSDSATQFRLSEFENLLIQLIELNSLCKKF